MEAYVDHDLTGEEPELRPATRYQAMGEAGAAAVAESVREALAGS